MAGARGDRSFPEQADRLPGVGVTPPLQRQRADTPLGGQGSHLNGKDRVHASACTLARARKSLQLAATVARSVAGTRRALIVARAASSTTWFRCQSRGRRPSQTPPYRRTLRPPPPTTATTCWTTPPRTTVRKATTWSAGRGFQRLRRMASSSAAGTCCMHIVAARDKAPQSAQRQAACEEACWGRPRGHKRPHRQRPSPARRQS